MKYISCFSIEHAINLDCCNNIKPCCTGENNDTNGIFWMRNYNGGDFDVKQYLKMRNHYISLMRKGDIPEQCKGCFALENNEWDENPKVKYIAIANETRCSCNCIYCNIAANKDIFYNNRSYNVLPILKELKKNDLLQDTVLGIVGGECTEYEDNKLQEIVEFAINSNCNLQFFFFLFLFSEDIAKMLHLSRANLFVSADAGTRITYEKIKRVSAYSQVWKNLEKYVSESVPDKEKDMGFVIIKYVIVPGINDNVKEIKAFLKKIKKIGCKCVRFVVDYNWFMKNEHKPIPIHFWKLLDCIETYKSDIKIEYIENAIYLWQKRMIEDKNYNGQNPCE